MAAAPAAASGAFGLGPRPGRRFPGHRLVALPQNPERPDLCHLKPGSFAGRGGLLGRRGPSSTVLSLLALAETPHATTSGWPR